MKPGNPEGPDEFIPTRSSLLIRLTDWDDDESWRDFFNTYWKLIYCTATKAGLNDAEAQDVVQDTVISVAKKMRDFKYDPALGSFKGWLLQLTRWRVLNQLKKRMPTRSLRASSAEEGTGTSAEEAVPDESLNIDQFWDQEWKKNLIDAAIERVKKTANPRHYKVFYLHVVKQQPVREVARTLNVSQAQVHLLKHRLGARVKREVRRLEKQMF